MKIYIYVLKDPRNQSVRYVGKTNNPKFRMNNHKNSSTKTHRDCWVKSLLSSNISPIMEIIEEATVDNWMDREKFWISHYRTQGYDLCNHTDGGEGQYGRVFSKETREKIAIGHRGKKRSIKPPKQYMRSEDHRVSKSESLKRAYKNGYINPRATVTPEIVREIRKDLLTKSINQICEDRNLGYFCVQQIRSGKTWKHI